MKIFNLKSNIDSSLNLIDLLFSSDLNKTIKLVGYLIKLTQLTSVDLTEIYLGKFNFIRYLMCWFQFLVLNVSLVCLIIIINNDWFFAFFDNEYFPKNIKPILISLGLIVGLSISIRFDILMAEKNGLISEHKVFYYLQENIRSHHGLTDKNYEKLSIVAKFVKAVLLFWSILIIAITILAILYISIKSNRITLQLLTPFFIYICLLVGATLSLVAGMSIFFSLLLHDVI